MCGQIFFRPLGFFRPRVALFGKRTGSTFMDSVRQFFPCAANGVIFIFIENGVFSLRIGLFDCRNIAQQPSLALLNRKTEYGFWSGIAAIQYPLQFLPKRLQAFIIKIADDEYNPFIMASPTLPISSQHFRQFIE